MRRNAKYGIFFIVILIAEVFPIPLTVGGVVLSLAWPAMLLLLVRWFRPGIFSGFLRTSPFFLTGSVLLLLGVLMAALFGVNSEEQVHSIVHALKLSILLLFLFPILQAERDNPAKVLRAMVIACLINAALALVGRVYSDELLRISGVGRNTTVLSGAGGLALIGAQVYGYGLILAALTSRTRARAAGAIIAASALLVVVLDGSRTFALTIGVVTVLCALIAMYELSRRGEGRQRFVRIISVASVAAVLSVAIPALSRRNADSQIAVSQRVNTSIADLIAAGPFGMLNEDDPVRVELMEAAWNKIRENPMVGSGLSTYYATDLVDSQTIHNAYIQGFADLGLFGGLGYLMIVSSWIPLIRRAWCNNSRLPTPEQRAVGYGSMMLLVVYCTSRLAHPIGVEVFDWVPILSGIAWIHIAARPGFTLRSRTKFGPVLRSPPAVSVP